MAPQAPVLIDEKSLAEMLSVHVETMRRMRISGRAPPFIRLASEGRGRSGIRYDMSDVRNWLESRKAAP